MDLVRRSGWGAAPPRGKPVPIPTPVAGLFLHHTVGPDGGPDVIRGIQRFHQETRGWADIAYTWLYSPRDRVFYEGRGPGVAGAHTRGHNRTAHAVAVLGNHEVSPVPKHAIDDLAAWARWHGTAWGPDHYRPHSEVGATACPGKHLLNVIPDINALARADMTPPAAEPGQLEDDAPPRFTFDEYADGTRAWIAERVEPTYGSYDAWSDAVRRFGDD